MSVPAPRRQFDNNGQELEGQRGRLASWAETDGFDDPDVVTKSLADGRVAYRAMIPPGALKLVEIPSEGASRFRVAARDVLELDDVDLPPPPELAFWEVELDRACALAETMVARALLVADETIPERGTVRAVDGALHLGEDLRRKARELSRAAELDRAQLVEKASLLAQRAAELRELG